MTRIQNIANTIIRAFSKVWKLSYNIAKMVLVILGIITLLRELAPEMPALQSWLDLVYQELDSWFALL